MRSSNSLMEIARSPKRAPTWIEARTAESTCPCCSMLAQRSPRCFDLLFIKHIAALEEMDRVHRAGSENKRRPSRACVSSTAVGSASLTGAALRTGSRAPTAVEQ